MNAFLRLKALLLFFLFSGLKAIRAQLIDIDLLLINGWKGSEERNFIRSIECIFESERICDNSVSKSRDHDLS